MRILFMSKSTLDRRYGAAKLLVELAQALEERGAECTLVDPPTLGCDRSGMAAASVNYLRQQAGRFDVVEFDYKHLRIEDLKALQRQYGRCSKRPLFVARCQLWRGHLLEVPPPPLRNVRSRIGRLVREPRRVRQRKADVEHDLRVMAASDLVLVSNPDDHQSITAHLDLRADHVAVVTPGFDSSTAVALRRAARQPLKEPPIVAFVGTFDERKGGGDFPALVDVLARAVPSVRFRLLGTRGMLQTEASVLRQFPRRLRPQIEVVPSYAPDDLPSFLAGCAAGVFPSYAEGFGYGVLEMLAAGLPVVAYDRPGPPVMLPADHLVPVGRPDLLALKLAALLTDGDLLSRQRESAQARAKEFSWERTAEQTLKAYQDVLNRRETVTS